MIANPGFKLIDGEIAGAGTSGDATSTTSGTSGTGGSGPTGPTGPTGTGMEEPTGGTGAVCMAMTPCYTGSPGTQDVGTCRGGLTSCTPLGEFDACEGEVVPGLDPCATSCLIYARPASGLFTPGSDTHPRRSAHPSLDRP